ncbi:hypothetical protein [Candidatus Poriferisocius sp.]|uniref:hypothetical protein n=1 Tax=Candidatus Poriferisocius sp. TaxID=3101276 RepID=UPI003B02938D
MTARLVLRLTGDNARLGEVYASDLAPLLGGVDRAVNRTAAQIAGRAPGRGGRLPQTIVGATKLRLTAIKEGSLVLEFAPPDLPSDQEALDLDDMQLADSAIRTVIDVLEGSETGFPEATAVLSQLAEALDIGKRYETLALTQPGDVPREAVLDTTARRRLSVAAELRTRSDDSGTLVGLLYEADFEKNTARLRTPLGDSVTVRFDDSHAQSIKEALREQAQLRGSVTYNEATAAIVSVELGNIASAMQMGLMPDLEDFWMSQSLEELAESQGVSTIDRIEVLQDDTISEKEAEDFLAALEL